MSRLERLLYGPDIWRPGADGRMLVLPDDRIAAEAKRAEEIGWGERDARRELILLLVACWAWQLLGAALFGWATHIGDEKTGAILMASGLVVGYGGAYFTIVAFYARRAERDA